MKNTDLFINFWNKSVPLFYIETYGCQMNFHESEKISGILLNMGIERTLDKENADIIVFNTCCVRDSAERKIIGNIGSVKKLKLKRRNLLVIVCGCMTQQNGMASQLRSTFPFIDIIIGTHNTYLLQSYIEERIVNDKKFNRVLDDPSPIEAGKNDFDYLTPKSNGPCASVNIMYGCNNYCSYCIVPYVRGRERSRSESSIINEINALYNSGKREILLLGQNVNSYGSGTDTDFTKLLQDILKDTNVDRIRFMTSHPKDISNKLIDLISIEDRICNHIHLPVQSGNSHILNLMNRGYTREDYLRIIENIRKASNSIYITTDIIVGFPSETEEEFEDTMSLVEKVRFLAAYTFKYSIRTGTKAASMKQQISSEVKTDRIERLISLQNDITEDYTKSFIGTVQKVLVEDLSTRSNQDICGRADCGRMVNFPGNANSIGTKKDVIITEGKKTTLYGREVESDV